MVLYLCIDLYTNNVRPLSFFLVTAFWIIILFYIPKLLYLYFGQEDKCVKIRAILISYIYHTHIMCIRLNMFMVLDTNIWSYTGNKKYIL